MSTMTEAIEHVLATREVAEKVAAAKEEVREACAVAGAEAVRHSQQTTDQCRAEVAAAIRNVALTRMPLAATIGSLRADLETAGYVAADLRAEVEAVRDQAAEAFDTAAAAYEELRKERDRLRVAVVALVDDAVQMANSGDAGCWDPDEDPVIIQGRAALSATEKPSGASTPHPRSETP